MDCVQKRRVHGKYISTNLSLNKEDMARQAQLIDRFLSGLIERDFSLLSCNRIIDEIKEAINFKQIIRATNSKNIGQGSQLHRAIEDLIKGSF